MNRVPTSADGELGRVASGRIAAWHAFDGPTVVARLQSDPKQGLTSGEARKRLEHVGPNRLSEERPVTFWRVAREEISEPMILLLLAVGVIYALTGELRDAVAIFCIIAAITFVEVYNEYRAKAAIALLPKLSAPSAPVVRDGVSMNVPVDFLVPGDIVLLSPGERVPADLRLLEAIGLRIDESSLTGESAPASKEIAVLPMETELGDRRNMAYAGTLIRAGKGRGVVVATGTSTEIGRVAGLVRSAREPRTPLQIAMRQLSGFLVWLAISFSLVVPVAGLLFGQPLREMVLTGLALAFATIPEELPILITIVLGLGAVRLARQRAIVKNLQAAETLGAVSAIATDKTGTLTENRMTATEVRLPGQDRHFAISEAAAVPQVRLLLELGVLANDALLSPRGSSSTPWDGFSGDPTDVALLTAAKMSGLDIEGLRGGGPMAELTFDDRRRSTLAVYQREDSLLVAAKGAPETVLARCDREIVGDNERAMNEASRRAALVLAEEMAARGLRVLALAYRRPAVESREALPGDFEQMERCLVFAGLVGFADPPRPEVPRALAELRSAGIKVLMVTGDHPATAMAVARQVGIDSGRVLVGREVEKLNDSELQDAVGEVSVFARIAPEHKLRVVRALKARGAVVAVTGDGVNDAPALKEAAIGVAMGETGTDAAKEAAGMVLADDNFATIAIAVREGRKLFDNLRKAVRYYLAAKIALVVASLVAVLAHLPVPFAPVQIIVMELFMDVGASVTFTAEPAEGDVMARPPRDPKMPFVDGMMRLGIFAGGLSLGLAVLATYFWATCQGQPVARAQTVAFATWMFGHVILAVHMSSERQPTLRRGPRSNPALAFWGVGAIATLALAVEVPTLTAALKATPLEATDWLMAFIVPLLTTSWWEVWKLARWGRKRPSS